MAARHFGRWQVAIVLIALAAIALQVIASIAGWRSAGATPAQAWLHASYAALPVPAAAIGAIIALFGVRSRGTLVLALAIVLSVLANGLSGTETLIGIDRVGAVKVATAVAGFLAAASFLRATQLFPKALTAADLGSTKAPWPGLPWLRVVLVFLLRPWAVLALAALLAGVSVPGLEPLSDMLLVSIGAAYWYIQFRIGTNKARRRVTWFLQMAVAYVVLSVTALGLKQLLMVAAPTDVRIYIAVAFNFAAALVVSGCLAMAVFGAGAVNPALVVRATVIYGAAAALLLFLLNVILEVLIDSAVSLFGLSDRLTAAILGTLGGLLLDQLIRWLRLLLNRTKQAAPETAG